MAYSFWWGQCLMYASTRHLGTYCMLWTKTVWLLENCALYKYCTAIIPQVKFGYNFQNIPCLLKPFLPFFQPSNQAVEWSWQISLFWYLLKSMSSPVFVLLLNSDVCKYYRLTTFNVSKHTWRICWWFSFSFLCTLPFSKFMGFAWWKEKVNLIQSMSLNPSAKPWLLSWNSSMLKRPELLIPLQ